MRHRRARNQALRNLADPLSGPRDAAVTLAAFGNVYNERPRVPRRFWHIGPMARSAVASRLEAVSPVRDQHPIL